MPYQSEAQRKWMFAAETRGEVPKGTAEKWQAHTGDKELPEKVTKKSADDNICEYIKAEKVIGGKADNMKTYDFNPKQVEMGKKIELEHTNDPKIAEEITMDHLEEIPDYYTRLKDMEDEAKKDLGKAEAGYVYVTFDGDNIGKLVERAEAKNDEKTLSEVSKKIKIAEDMFRTWISRVGGEVIETGGDEGLGKIPESKIDKIEDFRQLYKDITDNTVTVGIGKIIPEASKARMLGKLTGKDKVVQYNEQTGVKLNTLLTTQEPQDEKEKIKDTLGLTKAGEGSHGGHVVGHTKSGKPIYNTSVNKTMDWSKEDHAEAAAAHKEKSTTAPDKQMKAWHAGQALYHHYKASEDRPMIRTVIHKLKRMSNPYMREPEQLHASQEVSKAMIVNKDTMSFTDSDSVNLAQTGNSEGITKFLMRFVQDLKAGDVVPIPVKDDNILKLYKVEDGIYSGHIEAKDGTITHNIDKATIPEIVTHLVTKEKVPEEITQANVPTEQTQSEDKNITINVVIKKSKEKSMDKLDKMIDELFGNTMPLNKAEVMDEDEKRKILEDKTSEKMERADKEEDQDYTDADYGSKDSKEVAPEASDKEEDPKETPEMDDKEEAPEKLEKDPDADESDDEDMDEESDDSEDMGNDDFSDEDFEDTDSEGSEEQPKNPKDELVSHMLETAKNHHEMGYGDNVKDIAKFLLHLLHTQDGEMPQDADKAYGKAMKMLPTLSKSADNKKLYVAYKAMLNLRKKFLSKGSDNATMITKILCEKKYGKELFKKSMEVGTKVIEYKLSKSTDDMVMSNLKKKVLSKSDTEETIAELRKSQDKEIVLMEKAETPLTKFFKSEDLKNELNKTTEESFIQIKKSKTDYVEMSKGKVFKKTDMTIRNAIDEKASNK